MADSILISVLGDITDVRRKFALLHRDIAGLGDGISERLKSSFTGVGVAVTAIATGVAGIVGSVLLIKRGLSEAAQAETLTAQFETLLGSAEAAKKRFADLVQFSQQTPFNLIQVAEGNRTLETLTRGALSGKQGMQLVADAATITGEPFQRLALHIGRVYDGLMNGRPVGASIRRLQVLGIVSSETRNKIEDLQKAGKSGNVVWQVAAKEIGKFSGNTERQFHTWSGQAEALGENISALFRAFGEPIMNVLKPILGDAVKTTDGLVPAAKAAGEAVAVAIGRLMQAGKMMIDLFRSGDLAGVAFTALSLGFKKAINVLVNGLALAVDLFKAHVVGVFNTFSDPEAWMAMWEIFRGAGAILVGAGATLIAGLIEGGRLFVDPVVTAFVFVGNKLIASFEIAVATLKAGMLGAAKEFLEFINDAPLIGGNDETIESLDNGLQTALFDLDKAFNKITESWGDTMNGVTKTIDSSIPKLKTFGNDVFDMGKDDLNEGYNNLGKINGNAYLKSMADAINSHKKVTLFDESREKNILSERLGKFFGDIDTSSKGLPGVKKGNALGDEIDDMVSGMFEAVGDSITSVGGGGGIFGGSNIAADQLTVQRSMDTRLASIQGMLEKQQPLTVRV